MAKNRPSLVCTTFYNTSVSVGPTRNSPQILTVFLVVSMCVFIGGCVFANTWQLTIVFLLIAEHCYSCDETTGETIGTQFMDIYCGHKWFSCISTIFSRSQLVFGAEDKLVMKMYCLNWSMCGYRISFYWHQSTNQLGFFFDDTIRFCWKHTRCCRTIFK